MKKDTKGFTLIELLVVIAIIGILSSVVLASLNTARRKARDARRIADIKQLQLALELYYDGCGQTYPLTLATTAADGCSGTTNLGSYIASIPKDPSNSSLSYNYQPIGSNGAVCPSPWAAATPCSSYRLGATLSDPGNAALTGDLDQDPAIAGTGSFDGKSNSAEGTACGTTAGGAGTETCYDVKP